MCFDEKYFKDGNVITMRNVYKSYGKGKNTHAVMKNFNMTIKKGSMWVLLKIIIFTLLISASKRFFKIYLENTRKSAQGPKL